MLTSAKSPKVRFFNQLKNKKKRNFHGKFLIEGIHLVDEARRQGLLDKVIYCNFIQRTPEGRDLLNKILSSGIPCEEASEFVIKHLSSVETPQGIIASAFPNISDLGDLFEAENPLIIVACGIQDPGNLGTIIRTADAAGCSGFILAQGSVDPYNEKVIRASSGSIFHLNIVRMDDIIDIISSLKRRGVKVISSFIEGSKSYFDAEYSGPTAILIGNEGQGLPENVGRLSDEVVSIPMAGKAESLNAAISAAVILYEALRQRGINAGETDKT